MVFARRRSRSSPGKTPIPSCTPFRSTALRNQSCRVSRAVARDDRSRSAGGLRLDASGSTSWDDNPVCCRSDGRTATSVRVGTREAQTVEVRLSRGRARESQDTESRDSNRINSKLSGYNSGAQSAPYISLSKVHSRIHSTASSVGHSPDLSSF